MTKVLNSDQLYENKIDSLKEKIENMTTVPKLSIIRFGQNSGDISYEKGIKNTASKLNIKVDVHELKENIDTKEVINIIERLNYDDQVGGILVFRPMPDGIDEEAINSCISPKKDLDCMNPINKSKVYSGNIDGFIPLSSKASVQLLEHYGYDLKGKNCVIVNDSQIVGKPLAMILLKKMATVTICHIYTRELRNFTKNADIIFVATGVAEMFDETYFSKDATVIDIGVSRNSVGKMCGDLNEEKIDGKIKAYSPSKGGVGKLTNLLLIESMINQYANDCYTGK